MLYITTDDLRTIQKDNVLNAVIENDNSLLDQQELTAMAIVKGLIGGLYDMELEFNQNGIKRNYFIVLIIMHIMLYNLAARTTPTQVPEIRTANYQKSMQDLKDILNQKLPIDLQLKDKDREQASEFYLGSNYRINTRY